MVVTTWSRSGLQDAGEGALLLAGKAQEDSADKGFPLTPVPPGGHSMGRTPAGCSETLSE